MAKTKQLKMAYDVQDIAFKAIKAWEAKNVNDKGECILPEYAAGELNSLVKAFETAQERVRICRNKPLPGSLKPEPKRKAKDAPAPVIAMPMPDDVLEVVLEAQASSS